MSRVIELRDFQIVNVRTARYREGTEGPEWSQWRSAALYVQRAPEIPCGRVVCVSLRGEAWAEYGPEDFNRGVFECEGYYLEIEGVTER